MIQRDIKGLSPAQVAALQAPQSGFNAGTQEKGVYVKPNTPTLMSNVLGLANAVAPAVNKAREDAFKQGQVDFETDTVGLSNTVDRAAKLIQDSSWMTRDVYAQGVKFQQYTEGQLQTQQSISNQVNESLSKGHSLEQFSQAIKPALNASNKQIHELGLTGEAKAAAQDQLLTYVATSQKSYQSAVEVEGQRLLKEGVNKISSQGMSNIAHANGDYAIISQALSTTANNIYSQVAQIDPKGARDTANAQTAGLITEVLNRVDVTAPQDIETINALSSWLSSKDAMQLDPKTRASVLKSITAKQGEVQDVQKSFNDATLNQADYAVNTGKQVDRTWLLKMDSDNRASMLRGDMSPEDYSSNNKKIWGILSKADKDAGKPAFNVFSNALERAQAGLSDPEHAKDSLAAIANQGAEAGATTGEVSNAAMLAGASTGNMKLIAAGAKLGFAPIMAMLRSGDAAQIAEANDGEMNDQFLEMQALYHKYEAGNNPLMAEAILEGIEDPSDRATMGYVLKTNHNDIASLRQSFNIEDGKTKLYAASGDMQNTRITADDIPNWRLWGQGFGGDSGAAALGRAMSDENDAVSAANINAGFQQWKQDAIRSGQVWRDSEQAFKAYRASGELVLMDYGFVPVSKNARIAATGGKGIVASPERMKEIMDAGREDLRLSAGPGKEVLSENYKHTFMNGVMIVTAYDEDGQGIATKHYDSYQQSVLGVNKGTTIKQDAQLVLANSKLWMEGLSTSETHGTKNNFSIPTGNAARSAGKYPNGRPISIVRNGVGNNKLMQVYPDESNTFGSNDLKSDVYARIIMSEGSVNRPTATDPSKPDVLTVGNGMSLKTIEHFFGPKGVQEFSSAALDMGSPRYARLFNAFADKQFEALPKSMLEAGLQPPTDSQMYDVKDARLLLADTMWHRPADVKPMGDIMRLAQTDRYAAIDKLSELPSFQEAKGERKQFIIDTINQLKYDPME